MAQEKHSSVASYIIVALILGVITYIEFAIVEYPQAWLGPGWTMFWLVTLSVAKFIMVIMFFMHLKDDDRTYTGFFTSGMVISMATFVGLTAMFILPRSVASSRPTDVAVGKATHEVPAELLEMVETDGQSRSQAEQAGSPRPANRAVPIVPPQAGNDASTYQVTPAPAGGQPAEAGQAANAGTGAETGTEAGAPTAPATGATSLTWDEAAGTTIYNTNCAACHQGSGQGIPSAFPPLADHAVHVYENGGREFLMDVLLFGMQGPIEVNGTTYNGMMPAWGHLADSDIANVINHIITAWNDAPDGFVPYQASDIAAQRDKGLSAAEVHDYREQLGL